MKAVTRHGATRNVHKAENGTRAGRMAEAVGECFMRPYWPVFQTDGWAKLPRLAGCLLGLCG